MFKQVLLGGSALVGVAALALPVQAGPIGSKDAMSVTIDGEFRFIMGFHDQDVSAGFGQGYDFHGDESEIKIAAKNTADNGLEYGVSIELNAGGGDTRAADESYAFVDSDVWGRVEMGDQDDASSRMSIDGIDVLVGRGGSDGDVADFIQFGTGRAISGPGFDSTGDDTKLTYFSPRLAGFQLGVTHTPDSGVNAGRTGNGGLTDTDNDGNFESVWSLAASYKGKFDDVKVELSVLGEFGDSETATAAATEGRIESVGVGANVTFGGFGIGAGYFDLATKGLAEAVHGAGGDAGSYYDFGVSYAQGLWGVSLGWFESSVGNPAGSGGDTRVQIISIDSAYTVAPGWELAVGLNFVSADNINATALEVNNNGTVFLISNAFKF
jgi:outer membrane protein OmpU